MSRCNPVNATMLLALVTVSVMCMPANADIINVPVDQPTIQAAIDAAAVSGDEIIVAPGTYNEAINFGGKAINLHSSGGAAVTIIDGTGQTTSVVSCVMAEGPGTVLNGFTIRGGSSGTSLGTSSAALGMYILDSSPTVTNCIFRDNTSSAATISGGGMYIQSFTIGGPNVTPTISNCDFIDNSLTSADPFSIFGGGGIGVKNAMPTITNCTFAGNLAPNGGAVVGEGGTTITLIDCTFTSNTAALAGGGIKLFADAGSVTNCTFNNNSASGTSNGGGGIATSNSGSLIESCAFTGNQAGFGAGIDIRNSNIWQGVPPTLVPSPTVINCTFDGNTANGGINGGGGGLWIERATSLVRDCTFKNNGTDGFGGGVVVLRAGPTIANCLFTNNSATLRGGGIDVQLFINITQVYYPVISNCTIVGNSVSTAGEGAGIRVDQAAVNAVDPVRISNCIVRGNTGGPNVVFPTASHPGWITLRHSNVEGAISGPFTGSGNIDADPMFVDTPNDDYHLLAGSPCIDSGHHWDLVIAGITADFDGDPRLMDGTGDGVTWADMGAFEYQGTAGTLGEFPLPLAYWHFNTFAGSGPVPADIGTGSINLSPWGGTVAADPIGAFFDINRVADTPQGTSLQLANGTGGNGTSINISFSMTGHENLKLSLVNKRSHSNSYNSGTWAWSTDGTNFTTMAGVNTCPNLTATVSTLQTVDFSAVPALNNAPSVTLRHTLSHTTPPPADRFITIDNLQLNADPIPQPCPADINNSGEVNVVDLLAIINAWGPCEGCPTDINDDDIVNVLDLLAVINAWGPCP